MDLFTQEYLHWVHLKGLEPKWFRRWYSKWCLYSVTNGHWGQVRSLSALMWLLVWSQKSNLVMATKSHCLHLNVLTLPWEFTFGTLSSCSSYSSPSLSDLFSSSPEYSLGFGDIGDDSKPFFSRAICSFLSGLSVWMFSVGGWEEPAASGEAQGVRECCCFIPSDFSSDAALVEFWFSWPFGDAIGSEQGGVKGLWSL